MQPILFFSHSSADKDRAEKLVRALEKGGRFKTTFDVRDLQPGQEYVPQLFKWLARCHGGILLITKNVMRKAAWVLQEATFLRARSRLEGATFRLFIIVDDEVQSDPVWKRWFAPLELDALQRLRVVRAGDSDDPGPIVDDITRALNGLAQGNDDFFSRLALRLSGHLKPIMENAEALQALSSRLADRLDETVARTPPNIERFVRVACPAAGTEIFGERLDRAFAPLKLLGVLAPPLYFIPGMRSLIGDPNASPGFATLAPGEGVLPLLATSSGQATRTPLTIVAGVAEPRSMMSRLFSSGVAAVFLGGGQHAHDQVVTLASAFGGVEREGGVNYLIDRGPSVTHFNYFRNDRTRMAIVDALLHRDRPSGFESARSLAELQHRFATAGESAPSASAPAGPEFRKS